MDDLVWFIFIAALFALLGFVLAGLGLAVWKKQKMDLIIRHHCEKVSEADKPAYCRLAGAGICVIGAGFLVSGAFAVFSQSLSVLIPMAAGLAAGLALLCLAGIRYNR